MWMAQYFHLLNHVMFFLLCSGKHKQKSNPAFPNPSPGEVKATEEQLFWSYLADWKMWKLTREKPTQREEDEDGLDEEENRKEEEEEEGDDETDCS